MFQDNRHMEEVRLSALRTDQLYPPGNIPGTHFRCRLSQPQDHSAAGRIISMKNSYVTIRNQTRDLPVCSAVPEPTAPLRTPATFTVLHVNTRCDVMYWAHRPALQESVWLIWIWEWCQTGSHHNAHRMTYCTSQEYEHTSVCTRWCFFRLQCWEKH